MNQNLKDIIAGFVSGWTQVIIMQPFEIVKIRLQTQSSTNPYYNGMVDCFKKIFVQQGPLSFYKGTVSPLIGIGFQASAMFFSYQYCKRFFEKFNQNKSDLLPLQYIVASAAIASFPTSLVASPVEHARIRVQIQKAGEAQLYKGSVDAGRQIIKNFGMSGFYRGFMPTWGRQCVGQMCYFFTYENILRACVKKDQKISDLPLAYSLLGGACAGIAFWILAYPFDYVKTLMQTDNLKKNESKYSGMIHCFKNQMQSGNIGTFYKGIGVALYRAAAVNAGAFFSFQAAVRYLGKPQASQ